MLKELAQGQVCSWPDAKSCLKQEIEKICTDPDMLEVFLFKLESFQELSSLT